MKRAKMLFAAILLAAATPPPESAVADAIAAARAEIAVTKAGGPYPDAWKNSRWLKARDAAADPDARALFEHVFYDQSVLSFRPALDPAGLDAFRAAMKPDRDAAARENSEWLKGVLARIGWFDISRYGAEASQAAWLIVQHADHDPAWQKEMLNLLAPKAEVGEVQGKYFAYLMDRVAVNAGRPQTYGTQGHCLDGVWQPREVIDPLALDRYRAEMGLEPLEDYRKRFTCD